MTIPPALPAATILVVRDGATGLEVLMVRRHAKSGFAAGALVFPGGKVDAADAPLAPYCAPADLLLYRIAAIRETWEEAGIFLARHKGGGLLTHDDVARLLHAYPDAATRLAAMLARESIELETDGLVRFAHWITPEAEPRRFDTQFFIAAAPPEQIAAPDGYETLDCVWLSAAAALAEADASRALVLFPTRLNLMRLARSATVAEALAAARTGSIVPVMPVMFVDNGKRRIRIAADSGYDITEMSLRDAGLRD